MLKKQLWLAATRFHFGSENWEEQLKKHPADSPIATFKRNVNTAFDKLHSLNKLRGLIACMDLKKKGNQLETRVAFVRVCTNSS